MRDFTDDLSALRKRLNEAGAYLDLEGRRARLRELDEEVQRPGLWNDQDVARRVTTEHSRVKEDVDLLDGLERRGFALELDEVSAGQEAGITSATFIVRGRYAYGLLSAEKGVHRLVRISPFDANARRQTSFASFEAVPFIEEESDEVEIDEKDLRIDTYRSSGAGGQHVNVTDSAVRITHLSTGIVVSCQNERSQHQNKARAMQILAAKLAEQAREERRRELEALAGEQRDVAWGSQIRSYVLAPYQMVKDLRTEHEVGNVQGVLDGDLDEFMEAWLRWRRQSS